MLTKLLREHGFNEAEARVPRKTLEDSLTIDGLPLLQ